MTLGLVVLNFHILYISFFYFYHSYWISIAVNKIHA